MIWALYTLSDLRFKRGSSKTVERAVFTICSLCNCLCFSLGIIGCSPRRSRFGSNEVICLMAAGWNTRIGLRISSDTTDGSWGREISSMFRYAYSFQGSGPCDNRGPSDLSIGDEARKPKPRTSKSHIARVLSRFTIPS